jgi:tetratricopeptide (TPR) repeat protein
MTRWLLTILVALAACAEGNGSAEPPAAAPAPAAAPQDPRDRNLERMLRLVRVTDDDDPQRPDFLYRTAELYLDKWQRPAPGDPDPGRWLERALASYQAAAAFPNYLRNDEVLFKLACLLQSAGRNDEARPVFDRIIKEHPDSRYVPDAWARRR